MPVTVIGLLQVIEVKHQDGKAGMPFFDCFIQRRLLNPVSGDIFHSGQRILIRKDLHIIRVLLQVFHRGAECPCQIPHLIRGLSRKLHIIIALTELTGCFRKLRQRSCDVVGDQNQSKRGSGKQNSGNQHLVG